jgi:hypothetical protein
MCFYLYAWVSAFVFLSVCEGMESSGEKGNARVRPMRKLNEVMPYKHKITPYVHKITPYVHDNMPYVQCVVVCFRRRRAASSRTQNTRICKCATMRLQARTDVSTPRKRRHMCHMYHMTLFRTYSLRIECLMRNYHMHTC